MGRCWRCVLWIRRVVRGRGCEGGWVVGGSLMVQWTACGCEVDLGEGDELCGDGEST